MFLRTNDTVAKKVFSFLFGGYPERCDNPIQFTFIIGEKLVYVARVTISSRMDGQGGWTKPLVESRIHN